MIELFLKSSVNTKLKSYIITLDNYSLKNNIYLFIFVLSKIKRIMKKNSFILRICINRIIVITSSNIDEIYNLIDRVNSDEEIISIKLIDYKEYLNSKEFVNLFL